jgi:hypothetical protein
MLHKAGSLAGQTLTGGKRLDAIQLVSPFAGRSVSATAIPVCKFGPEACWG